MAVTYLALGANLGDREKNLRDALARISPFVQITRVSSIYETEPWGVREQPWFLNLVLEGTTTLSPVDLLRRAKRIENEMGRAEGIRFGPRPIDIDILFYDRLIELSPALTIPHPRLHERAFVLVPLAELAPDLIHPRLRVTVRELLNRLESTEGVRLYESLTAAR
ncbi:MAG: 2-amino-4-hydroxy-6-hydroxymethyldihydropteridine diphosphokinase [Chloroflexota bacterium]|nr:2-amino-4-hydroxy-6-hydroxymethyldihydropteridine diphosphokinase [Chloroflexota bacterium]